MADGTTPNLGLVKPQPGGSRDSWGDKMNANLDTIDTQVQGAKAAAAGAVSKAADSGAYLHYASAALSGGRLFIVPSTGTDPTSQPGDIWFGYTP